MKMELKPGKYRHFKGREYELIGIAKHSETLEPMVVYRQLYGEHGLWVRPAAMWTETVDRDGYHGPRFQYIGD
ncbi:MAG: DUF1653 domain-containing protein [Faecousia sp.]